MAKTRKYRLQRRAQRQGETRQRIVEAAVELHTTLGPARTTIGAIAAKARVQRLTVYRHFPDLLSLGWACSAHYQARNPPPDYRAWTEEKEAGQRVRRALDELYRYYERTEGMWSNVLRDAEVMPEVQVVSSDRWQFLRGMRDVLVSGFGGRKPTPLLAAVGHALDFRTWESLVRHHGLTREQAVELMVGLVTGAAGGPQRR